MAHAYATIGDVYREIGAAAFLSRPRPIDARAGDSFDYATGTFTIGAHGYDGTDRVRLALVASAGTLPGSAVASPYYVLKFDYWRFQLSLTQGGAAVTFTSTGAASGANTYPWGVQLDPEPRLQTKLYRVSEIIDECLTAHSAPILVDPITGEYPGILVGLAARMAARRTLTASAFDNEAARVAMDTLRAQAAFDGDTDPPAQEGSLLGDWKGGKPIYPKPKDQNEIPDNAARARGGTSSGWKRACL